MSIFRWSDYKKDPDRKLSQRTQKKTKLPTSSKTKKCTYCNKPGTTLTFGKEKRTLCKDHIIQLNSKNDKYEPAFRRASGRKV